MENASKTSCFEIISVTLEVLINSGCVKGCRRSVLLFKYIRKIHKMPEVMYTPAGNNIIHSGRDVISSSDIPAGRNPFLYQKQNALVFQCACSLMPFSIFCTKDVVTSLSISSSASFVTLKTYDSNFV